MFENLKDKLQTVFSVLGKKGILTEKDIDNALSEVRIALLEADVSLIVVKMLTLRDPKTSVTCDKCHQDAWGEAKTDGKPPQI